MHAKIPVGILGATGMVGQRFIQLLEHHPWFEVTWLGASERSEGKPYAEAAKWRMKTAMPKHIASMMVSSAEPKGAPKLVLAALDSKAAAHIEPKFVEAGHILVSNSAALRMDADVPLVIPEVNAGHLKLVESKKAAGKGFAVTNPNCSTIGLVMALSPLQQKFGLESIFVVTMQAISGAGYPGVASWDILGNVVPYISNEEEKMEAESRKLLGDLGDGEISMADFRISAQCNRVAVEDGHTESVAIKLRRKASAEEILAAWREFRPLDGLHLPSAPPQPVIYETRPDRPQPRFDVDAGKGMATVVGRLRPCSLLDWKFTVLSHNTIRGAAGAALLNAEIMKAQGYLG